LNAAWSLNYRVREGHRGDAAAVLDIFLSAMQEHGLTLVEENVDLATFGSGKNPAQDDFVVVSGGKVCGFLILGPTMQDGRGELRKVFVARSHRGQGIGTMLVGQCILRAKERGYRELVLQTDTAFAQARRYYERHGWTLGPHWPEEISTSRTYALRLYGDGLRAAQDHVSQPLSGVRKRVSPDPVAG
jgi:GNAT superfamily N-acetyltransferase